MADDRRYIVPYFAPPRLYRSLSGYLQSIAPYAPVLAPGSLPAKIATAKAAAAKAAAAKRAAAAKDQPVAGEPYKIELPDGKLIEGRLGEDGTARHARLEPGNCKVTFPWRDPAWWDPVPDQQPPAVEAPPAEPVQASLSATEQAWLEIELRDDEKQPVDGEPYRIQASDGTLLAEGTLDEHGCARIEGLPPGACKVVFPLREPAWWKGTTQEQPPALEPLAEPIQASLPKT
jgi:hypothetical protein